MQILHWLNLKKKSFRSDIEMNIYKHIYDYTLRHYDFTFVNPSSLITQRNVVDLTIMYTIFTAFSPETFDCTNCTL
jgi:hypothetical protein